MKINLNSNNYEKTIEVYCSKIQGKIKLVYIDIDTGEELEVETLNNLPLGDHEVIPKNIKGYEIRDIKERDCEEERKEEVKKINEDSLEFNITEFCKDLSSFGIVVGDEDA